MTLDANSRGALESIIDGVIKQTPSLVETFRKAKSRMQITNESDYVFGLESGVIFGSFTALLISLKNRQPDLEELDQIMDILIRRSREIRDAIFNIG